MVWIGKISYSLYLWHWVVLALFRYVWQESELPMGWIIVAVILTFGLSVITYYLIENPIRSVRFSLGKSVAMFYILPASLVLGIFFSLYQDNVQEQERLISVKGDSSIPPKAIVIGDSHAMYLSGFVDKIGKKEGWSAEIDGILNCPFTLEDNNKGSCGDRNRLFFQEYGKYPIVILVSYLGVNEDIVAFETTIKELLNQGKKVYVVNSSNKSRFHGSRLQALSEKGGIMKKVMENKISSLKNNVFHQENIDKTEEIRHLIAQYPQVKWIDLTPYLFNILEEHKYQNILFDDNHFTENGANLLAEEFIKDNKILIDPKDLQ